jgi:hypothetical protein
VAEGSGGAEEADSRTATDEGGETMPSLKGQAAERTYTFPLLLRGANPLDDLDELYEAGCDDAMVWRAGGGIFR